MLSDGIEGLATAGHDLCVVGSGPVGLALATDLARRGRRVLLLESGGTAAESTVQALSDADILDPSTHDDMGIAVSRQLGGTSNLWGARCLPFDPIDFEERDWIGASWPIGHGDMARWLPQAVEATRSGAPVYHEAIAGLALSDDRFDPTALERWANRQQAQAIHAEAIATDERLDVRTHATLVGIDFAGNGCVEGIEIADSRSGAKIRLPIATLVLAAGGLETTRLLLAAQRRVPMRFGGEDGPLGRYYMGHLVGEIADIQFTRPDFDKAFDFQIDAHGSYARRRIVPSAATQRAHRLLNCALWPIVPPIADARHGSAILSLVYCAMRWGPIGRRLVAEKIRQMHISEPAPPLGPHLVNLLTGAPSAALFAANFLRRRYDKRTRLPGFFIHNRGRRYGLTFHSEQFPRADSRVTLAREADRLGMPRLAIDYRFHADDAASVVRTHDVMEEWLATTGLGRLEYRVPREARAEAVLGQVVHGTHQIGLARMGSSREEGVVDADLACFDAPNLYVASTAALPTSGQANPTLTAVALAFRLSAHLAERTAPLIRTATLASA